jgi:hypothetical protein
MEIGSILFSVEMSSLSKKLLFAPVAHADYMLGAGDESRMQEWSGKRVLQNS